jgi:hypothetical protein
VEALRKKLLGEVATDAKIDARGLKPHQVHELAAAKIGTDILPNIYGAALMLIYCRGERAAAERAGHI